MPRRDTWTAPPQRGLWRLRRRNGFMLVEMLVGLILLATVATMVPLLLRTVYQQRQQERFCRFSQMELANIAVQLRAHSSDGNVTDDITLSEWFRQYFSDATMQLTPVESSERLVGLQSYQIAITRPGGDARPDSNQVLTVWIETAREPAE
jgi:type II secretory pathway pseudopilin PulG